MYYFDDGFIVDVNISNKCGNIVLNTSVRDDKSM